MEYMGNQKDVSMKQTGLTVLDFEQKALKQKKNAELCLKILKLLIRLGGLIISFYILFLHKKDEELVKMSTGK